MSPRRKGRWAYRVASVLGLLASAGGGYFGYQKFTELRAEKAQEQSADELASTGDPETATEEDDPFEDGALKLADNSDADDLLDAEPRRMGHPPQAAPLARRHAAEESHTPAKKKAALPEDELLDLDDASEAEAPPRISDLATDDDEDLGGPSLERRTESPKRPRHTGRSEPHVAAGRSGGRREAAGPRLESLDQDLPADIEEDFSDERLDGYGVSDRKRNKKPATHAHSTHAGGPKISIVDARDDEDGDERLDGFTVEEPAVHRAVSKTKIVRPTSEEALVEGPTANSSEIHQRSGTGAVGIQPRGHAGDNRKHPHKSADDGILDTEGATGELYRVVPDDSFWKISRKQYGSARYYQALMRHNQERVPDAQKLRPGTQLSIPSTAYLERTYPDLIDKSATAAARPASPANATVGIRPRFDRPAADRDQPGDSAVPVARGAGEGYFYSKSGEPMYRIGTEDTLTSIAQRHLGRASRWTEIYEQNQDILSSPDNLTLGTVIRLPGDASRLSLVPENRQRR